LLDRYEAAGATEPRRCKRLEEQEESYFFFEVFFLAVFFAAFFLAAM
jgi:hypothetical protein